MYHFSILRVAHGMNPKSVCSAFLYMAFIYNKIPLAVEKKKKKKEDNWKDLKFFWMEEISNELVSVYAYGGSKFVDNHALGGTTFYSMIFFPSIILINMVEGKWAAMKMI